MKNLPWNFSQSHRCWRGGGDTKDQGRRKSILLTDRSREAATRQRKRSWQGSWGDYCARQEGEWHVNLLRPEIRARSLSSLVWVRKYEPFWKTFRGSFSCIHSQFSQSMIADDVQFDTYMYCVCVVEGRIYIEDILWNIASGKRENY